MTETPKNKRPQAAKPEAHKQKQSSQPSVANELRGARVRASIWHDAAFLRLSPDAQRLFLMLSTMPEEHISGLTTMAPETMGARLRMSPRQVRTRLVELMHAGFVAFDDINSLCPLFWLLRHYETQLGCEPTTDEQVASTGRHIERLPSGATLTQFCLRYGITPQRIAEARGRLQHSRKLRAASRTKPPQLTDPLSLNATDPLAGPLPMVSDPLTDPLADPPMHIALVGAAPDAFEEEVRRVG